MQKISRRQDIQRILAVLLSAIICAGLFAAYMIYHYGPSGRYIAANTILSPYVLEQISYKDAHSPVGKGTRLVFNNIEVSYFDTVTKTSKRLSLDPAVYETFYNRVAADKSIEQVTPAIAQQFSSAALTISIMMRDNAPGSLAASKVFQIIQLVENDYFRVQLKGDKAAGEWAYFYDPGLYQEALQLFMQSSLTD